MPSYATPEPITVDLNLLVSDTRITASDRTDTVVGASSGHLRIKTANGNITVQCAGGDVDAKTASGNIRLAEVVRGSIDLETTAGELEIGIREGTAAWLNLDSKTGMVRNELD